MVRAAAVVKGRAGVEKAGAARAAAVVKGRVEVGMAGGGLAEAGKAGEEMGAGAMEVGERVVVLGGEVTVGETA